MAMRMELVMQKGTDWAEAVEPGGAANAQNQIFDLRTCLPKLERQVTEEDRLANTDVYRMVGPPLTPASGILHF
eukprot:1492098-Pyramimonas_sp.AAC.1